MQFELHAKALELLADIVRQGYRGHHVDEKITVAARSDEHQIQVVLTVSKWAPMLIHEETLRRIEEIGRPVEPPTPRLSPRQRRILQVLRGQPPRKGEWIAIQLQKLKKPSDKKRMSGSGGGFRGELSELVKEYKLLTDPKENDGYQLTERGEKYLREWDERTKK